MLAPNTTRRTFARVWGPRWHEWRLHLQPMAAIAVAFVCLGAVLIGVGNARALSRRWENLGTITVYMKANATEADARDFAQAIAKTPAVDRAEFVSSEQARAELVMDRDDSELAGLPATAFPASVNVYLTPGTEDATVASLVTRLEAVSDVESVETYAGWAASLRKVLSGGVTASLALGLVALLATVGAVVSTVRLSLQRRLVEVEVLRMVGADPKFIRKPFVVEAAVETAVGALAALVLLAAMFFSVQSQVGDELAAVIGGAPSFLGVFTMLAMVAGAALLGAASALLSLRKGLHA